jgi:alkanesulfonate monooxygenase SsuD/methylene tetrahydromethanopterin reductase-like flavin-dependent oxidoreductase (luciferase family)
VTWRARIVVVGGDESALATLDALSRGRVAVARVTADELVIEQQDATPERWERAAFPEGRAAWRELRTAREADGVSGLVLANDPRLLDLLRNPDVEDDRPDLRLAFG